MKTWTVLVYLAGDNGRFLSSLEGEGVSDLIEMKGVGSSAAVNIVAQFDAMSDGACRRYYITKGTRLSDDLVRDLGETNSGDAQVLLDFISWGVRAYPAEHYLLVLWNHGAGWKDDDVYAPYRSLSRQGRLPPAPPHIAGRRVSRALFRRSLEAILEEETNRVLLLGSAQHRGRSESSPTVPEVLPAGWISPPDMHDEQPTRPTVAVAGSARGMYPRAICFDDSSKDFLDSREMTEVLDAAVSLIGKKIDVLGFDACLMSMIEVAYQVRTGARVMVASEDVEPGSGWPYSEILTTLTGDPTISPQDLGKAIIAHYVAAYDRSLLSVEPITQSALDLEQAATVVEALDDLARGLLNGWKRKGLRMAVAEARRQAQTFMDPDYVDLFDLVSLLADKTGAKPVREACQRLLAVIEPGAAGSLVLADGHTGLAERNAHGLSIYFPQIGVSPFYAALEMSRDCTWTRFLERYLGSHVQDITL